MKETNVISIIPMSELVEDGVYFSNKNHLIQIKKIDNEKKELHFFNISEQINFYRIRFDRHNLVRRIR